MAQSGFKSNRHYQRRIKTSWFLFNCRDAWFQDSGNLGTQTSANKGCQRCQPLSPFRFEHPVDSRGPMYRVSPWARPKAPEGLIWRNNYPTTGDRTSKSPALLTVVGKQTTSISPCNTTTLETVSALHEMNDILESREARASPDISCFLDFKTSDRRPCCMCYSVVVGRCDQTDKVVRPPSMRPITSPVTCHDPDTFMMGGCAPLQAAVSDASPGRS